MATSRSTIRTNLSTRMRDTSHNIWTIAEKNEAINAAIRDAYPSWFTETVSSYGTANWLVVCEDKLKYTLPTMRRLLGVSLERCSSYEAGTATGATASTLTDSSQSWTALEFKSSVIGDVWHVVLYAGQYGGDYAVVVTNGTTSLTVSGTGYNWGGVVYGDGSDKYMIKKVSEETHDWREIWAYRVDKDESPTTLYLTAPYVAGMYLKLHYLTEPAELATDAAETSVPQEWIIRQAAAHLHLMRIQNAPGNETEVDVNLLSMYQGMADEYRHKHAMRFPAPTIRTERETEYHWTPDEYPF